MITLIIASTWCISSCFYNFLVIQNKQIIDHLVKMVERAFSQMEITENMYRSLQNSINLSKKGGYVFCYNAPVLIIVANKKDYGNNQADCALALENMMLSYIFILCSISFFF